MADRTDDDRKALDGDRAVQPPASYKTRPAVVRWLRSRFGRRPRYDHDRVELASDDFYRVDLTH